MSADTEETRAMDAGKRNEVSPALGGSPLVGDIGLSASELRAVDIYTTVVGAATAVAGAVVLGPIAVVGGTVIAAGGAASLALEHRAARHPSAPTLGN